MEPMFLGMQFPIPPTPIPQGRGVEKSVSPPLRAGEGLGVGGLC